MTRHPSAHPAARANGASAPTPYAELNALLNEFADQARAQLGDNFIAAYLQGSFALGDFDQHSDVDWLIVTERELTEQEEAALQAMHADLHERPNPWAARLEGSYFPASILRRWSESPRDPPGRPPRPADWSDPATSGRPPRVYPLLFKGNGEKNLVRSEHDNTQVVRWVTRERGVVLAGPPPRALIDPISAEALRAEVRPLLKEIAAWRRAPERIDARWLQAFFVILACRMLHTLETGAVSSKKAAADWAGGALQPRWRELIAAAQAVRVAPLAERLQPADANAVRETLDFLTLAEERASAAPAAPGSREIVAKALARKSQGPHADGGPRGFGPAKGGARHGQYSPPPMRPGGRGRRG